MKNFFAVAIALVLLISGCSGKESVQDEPPITNDFNTNTLTLFMPTPDTLNPLYSSQTANIKIYDLIYDSLICLDNDLSVIPQLAESCTVSADCKTITFTLKSGVLWHDGVPFTSADVKYTFDKLLAADYSGPYKQNVSRISHTEVVDAQHFKITLNSPYSRILSLLTFPIIPSHRSDIDTNPCGTGQYKFAEYHEKSHILLTKNTLWKLGDIPIEESVRVNILDNTEDITSVLNLGEISAVTVSATDLPETGIVKTMQQHRYTSLNYQFIGFNLSNKIFARKTLRRAVSAALDRQSLLDGTYFGAGIIANCPVHPRAYYYTDDIDDVDYNKDSCAAIFLEGGWGDSDSNGIYDFRFDDGVLYSAEATLLVNEDNPFRIRCAAAICSMLAEHGISVVPEPVPWEEYCERIQQNKYSMFLGGMELSADMNFSPLFRENACEWGANYMLYSSDQMNKTLDDINYAISTEEIKNAYLNFEYIFTQDLPCIGLFFTDDILLYSERLEGVETPFLTRPLADISRWHFTSKQKGSNN